MKWNLNYNPSSTTFDSVINPPGYTSESLDSTTSLVASSSKSKPLLDSAGNVVAPPAPRKKLTPTELEALKQQKAWDLALSPAKNVPIQALMMYMTGGGIQIFSVMSVFFLLKQAISGMLSVEKAFAGFLPPILTLATPALVVSASKAISASPPSFVLQKAVFVACQFALLCVGLWKCNQMGLLPNERSDWEGILF